MSYKDKDEDDFQDNDDKCIVITMINGNVDYNVVGNDGHLFKFTWL